MSNEQNPTAASDRYSTTLQELRSSDPDRYLQVLLAPSPARAKLIALFSLNAELARIPDTVSQPIAGMIRLQWWRDGLAAAANGAPTAHPLLSLLAASDLFDITPPSALEPLLDAREGELDASPVAGAAAIETRARATAGRLNALAAAVLALDDAAADKAKAVGTAYGMTGILRALPFGLRREPRRDGDANPDTTRPTPAALSAVAAEIAARAEAILNGAGQLRGRSNGACFVLATLAKRDLDRLRRTRYDVFAPGAVERPPWVALSAMAAATLGRY